MSLALSHQGLESPRRCISHFCARSRTSSRTAHASPDPTVRYIEQLHAHSMSQLQLSRRIWLLASALWHRILNMVLPQAFNEYQP
eukprot:3440132-Amphidinium_carterae.1